MWFCSDAELHGASVSDVRILRGHLAAHRSNYREAIQHLEQAVRLAPHSVPAFIANLPHAKAAIAEASFAKELLPDNPVAIGNSLIAHLVSAGVYEDLGNGAQRRNALGAAATDAAALKPHTNSLTAAWGRAQYFNYIGDETALLEELHRSTATFEDPLLDYLHALSLYAKGEFKRALEALARTRSGSGDAGDFCRGYILAELADGPQRALKEVEELMQRRIPALHTLYFQTVLRLLGRTPEAVAACLKLREQGAEFPGRSEWYQQVLEYGCERLSANDLLKAAGNSRWNRSEAHFFIALSRLGEGDRAGAPENFSKCVSPGFHSFEYGWSRAFVARMERDSAWPPWIPQRQ